MEPRLSLDEVKDKIKAETIEQVEEWCRSRNLKIYEEGFAGYVFNYEFELGYDFEYIIQLIEEYGTGWFEYYTSRESKTHIPPSKISVITSNYPAIKKGQFVYGITSSVLIQSDKTVYTVKEAANAIGVCTKTIRNLVKAGNLSADIVNTSIKNKHYRISRKSRNEYLAGNNKRISS